MNELIACCGLDCEKCDARIATLNNDNALREKTANFWSQLNGVEITPEMINCEGCRVGNIRTPFCESLCQIRKCVRQKKYETCAECDKLKTCETLGQITNHAPQALNNLLANNQ